MQALTYDVRRERDREKKEFMRGGAAALIQVCLCHSLAPQTIHDCEPDTSTVKIPNAGISVAVQSCLSRYLGLYSFLVWHRHT